MGIDTPLLPENMELQQQKVQFTPALCWALSNQGKRRGSLSQLAAVH